ncbi:YD repeat-containing protein [Sphingobacterium sp. KU25419]|nr:YD repeat-containing protein [Sphingobacterium sp. KU25419]
MKASNKFYKKKQTIIAKGILLLFFFALNGISVPLYSQVESYNMNFKKDHFLQMKSPNVAIMDRFDTFKVNYFNGLPEISIPLFEIKTRGFSIPINLEYHSSGIKVADVASWVGLGWNLTGQYQISRSVKGSPDEGGFLNPNFNFLTSNDVIPSTLLGYKKLQSLMPPEISTNLFAGADSEPDIFHYSLINKSGSFRFLKNAVPITIPYEPVLIQSKFISPTSFNGFKLTDENGIKFSFGQSNNGQSNYFEGASSVEGGRAGNYVSAWLVSDIVNPQSNDSIQYEYYPKQAVTNFSGYGVNILVLDQYNAVGTSSIPAPTNNTTYPSRSSTGEQHLLKSLTFENGKIDYILSPNNRNDLTNKFLSQINIYKKVFDVYELVKSVKFIQTYFDSEDGDGRLKLDRIEIETPSEELQIYKFEYNESLPLPKPSSLAMDYWGYYNKATSNITGIPDTLINYSGTNGLRIGDPGKGRFPDTSAVQIGILKKIIYPTGGYTTYDYESNKISQHAQTMIGGGVRIKQIKSFASAISVPLVRTFKYGQADGQETGLGFVNANTQFNFLPYTMLGEYYDWSGGDSPKVKHTYRIRTFNNNMSYDQNDYDNSNVVYPFVTEYIGDEIDNLGKNTYRFSYTSDELQPDFMRVRPVSISTHWRRGKLLEKISYKKQGSLYAVVESEEIVYEDVNSVYYPNSGILVGSIVSKQGVAAESNSYVTFTYPYHAAFYGLTSGAYLPRYRSKISYSDNAANLQTNVSFYYDGASNISGTKELSSIGDTLFTYSKYPSSYQSISGSNDFINSLKKSNILNRPIEQYLAVKKKGEAKPLITSGLLNIYNNGNPTLKEIHKLQTNSRLNDFFESSSENSLFSYDSRYKKEVEFVLYDRNNSLNELHKDEGKAVSYQWGSYLLSPVVEVTNAKNAEEVKHLGTGYTPFNLSTTSGSSSEFTFTVGYNGNAKLTMFSGTFLASATTLYVRYELTGPKNQSGSLCMNNNSSSGCYSGLESAKTVNFTGLLPGTYKIKVTCETTISGSTVSLGFDYPTTIIYSTNGKEFFYEGFEENKNYVDPNSFAGNGCFVGDYGVSFNMPDGSGEYVVDYRYRISGKWFFAKKKYVNGMVLNEGDAIDEVRVYPVIAQMTTYTYDQLFGVTSKINPSGQAEFYDYDGFGRLKSIADHDRNVTKSYEYNYKK